MAARKGSSGKTPQRRSSSSGRSRRKTTTKRGSSASAIEISLRPEHQRELFALALITIALVTIIFFITGTAGGIGSLYIVGMQQAFGSGALVIPLALGVLGGVILLQERLQDTSFSGSNLLGTVLILGSLLALLEFPVHQIAMPERADEGGGMVGYTFVYLLDTTIGRPAAIVVVVMLALAGIMLTFNITLRELIPGMLHWLRNLWNVAWSGSRRPASSPEEGEKTQRYASGPEPLPDSSADIVLTPIAERPTRASLFRRPDSDIQKVSDQPKHSTTKESTKKESASPSSAASLTSPANGDVAQATAQVSHAATSAAHAQDVDATGVIQERLEEFDVPPIHLAWPLPSIDLLDKPSEETSNDDNLLNQMARLIEETLASFKVEAQIVDFNTGPVITQFELQPGVGVKISKITTLEKDLALALAAPSIRIEAPIPGKSAVGIEIPNSAISVVTLREVVDSDQFNAHRGKLKMPLGKDVSGVPVVADMAKMPHLLVAGSTGSGKSVAINAFLCGLLLKHTPEELRIIMVDPKMVELIVYNNIPHLLSPVVTELERVVPTLKWATREMERRYKVFARYGCRNLESYMKLTRTRSDLEPMPYILVVIDELADLMMMAPDEVETQICRLAQMARATGIHLIIATQRPSVDVITGLIKANFPSRIAFAVTSQVDSRVILDVPGADRLLGRGDMLYMGADTSKLMRMQGTFVSDSEVEQIVSFWREATPPDHQKDSDGKLQRTQHTGSTGGESQTAGETSTRTPSENAPAISSAGVGSLPGAGSPGDFLTTGEQDELLPKAVELVRQHTRASASLLQRRLRIGYSKASQLIDLLEQNGIVGPAEAGRSREVIDQESDPGAVRE